MQGWGCAALWRLHSKLSVSCVLNIKYLVVFSWLPKEMTLPRSHLQLTHHLSHHKLTYQLALEKTSWWELSKSSWAWPRPVEQVSFQNWKNWRTGEIQSSTNQEQVVPIRRVPGWNSNRNQTADKTRFIVSVSSFGSWLGCPVFTTGHGHTYPAPGYSKTSILHSWSNFLVLLSLRIMR